MRFTPTNFLTSLFRSKFIDAIDRIAPEVLRDLKGLIPQYELVFGQNKDAGGFVNLQDRFDWMFTTPAQTDRAFILSILTRDPDYKISGSKGELETLKNYFELQNSFAAVLSNYNLHNTDWLKSPMMYFLGRVLFEHPDTKRFQLPLSYIAHMPFGEKFTFEEPGWFMIDDSTDWANEVRERFKVKLQNYVISTEKNFKDLGYKRYKVRNFERLKWLVWWTVQGVEKAEIIRRIEQEKSTKKGKEINIDSNTIDKAFAEFRGYDLPVR